MCDFNKTCTQHTSNPCDGYSGPGFEKPDCLKERDETPDLQPSAVLNCSASEFIEAVEAALWWLNDGLDNADMADTEWSKTLKYKKIIERYLLENK